MSIHGERLKRSFNHDLIGELEAAVGDEEGKSQEHRALDGVEDDVVQEGSGVLERGVHGVGVVRVEVANDVCDTVLEGLTTEEGTHCDNGTEQHVLKVGVVSASAHLIHGVGEVERSSDELSAHAEEDQGEEGLEQAEEVTNEDGVSAISSERVALTRGCTPLGSEDRGLDGFDAGTVSGDGTGEDHGDLGEASPEGGISVRKNTIIGGGSAPAEGTDDNEREVEPEVLVGKLAEEPRDASVKLIPGKALFEHAVLGSLISVILADATVLDIVAVLAAGSFVNVAVEVEGLNILDEVEEICH